MSDDVIYATLGSGSRIVDVDGLIALLADVLEGWDASRANTWDLVHFYLRAVFFIYTPHPDLFNKISAAPKISPTARCSRTSSKP